MGISGHKLEKKIKCYQHKKEKRKRKWGTIFWWAKHVLKQSHNGKKLPIRWKQEGSSWERGTPPVERRTTLDHCT